MPLFAPGLEFYWKDDYVVASKPLTKLTLDENTVNIWLVFLADFKKCPELCFSSSSGRKVVEDKLSAKSFLANCTQNKKCDLSKIQIKRYDYFRIFVRYTASNVQIHVRMKDGAFNYDLVTNDSKPLFLALKSDEILSPDFEYCRFSILSRQDFLLFLDALKAKNGFLVLYDYFDCELPSKTSALYAVPVVNSQSIRISKKLDNRSLSNLWLPPLCFSCMENKVEVIMHDCNHAMFCDKCYKKYLNGERKRLEVVKLGSKADGQSLYVRCPLCRRRIQSIGRVWFVTKRCLLCGCSKINAVGGGPGGCGCVFGCYDEARKLLKQKNASCPYCGNPLVEVVRIYIQGDTA